MPRPEALIGVNLGANERAVKEAWNKAAIDAHVTQDKDTILELDGIVKEGKVVTVYAHTENGTNVQGKAVDSRSRTS